MGFIAHDFLGVSSVGFIVHDMFKLMFFLDLAYVLCRC